jgi:uncharacterized cupin superfamily protein
MSTPIQYVELGEDLWTEARDSALTLFKTEEAELGILELSPGTRLPREGYSIHASNDEFAYIISGEVVFWTDKGATVLREGMLIYNKKGTPHYTENLGEKPARIVWLLAPPRGV